MLNKPSEFLAEMKSIILDYEDGIISNDLCVNCLRNLHFYACRVSGSVAMTIRENYQIIMKYKGSR